MATALDCTGDCSTKAVALRAAGYDTVIRYYSVHEWKRMGAAEAQALSQAGLKIGAVYQDRQNQAADFSQAKGNGAGQRALDYAQSVIMQPEGTAIYFSADFDPSDAVIANNIVPFFKGVQAALGGAAPLYKIGVYGSGPTCEALLAANLVTYTWLTQSKGFRGYDAYLSSGKWNLSQLMPATILGLDCDPDDVNPSKSEFGAFTLPSDHFGPSLPSSTASRYAVNAATGLRVRGGPGTNFDVLKVLANGTIVTVTHRDGDWAQVDSSAGENPDGYVFSAYLKPA